MPATSNTKKAFRTSRARGAAGGEDASRKDRILTTAIEQFAEKGFAAVRIDEVAADAGANKQLIYYYFDSKAGLYDAALARLVELIAPVWAEIESAPTLEKAIERYRQRSDLGVLWRRFVAWEGIEGAVRGGAIRLEAERTAAWHNLIRVVEKAQSRGELRADLDPAMFALLITSFTNTPLVLPQVVKMIVGVDPDSEDFVRRQGKLFEVLLAALGPDPTS